MANVNSLNVTNVPEQTATVEDFIEMGASDEMTYKNFSVLVNFIGKGSVVEYTQDNVIYDYMDELLEKSVVLELSDNDFVKYRYKPKLLSYDIYGTTELYFVIMALNGMCNIKDFNKRKLKLLYKSDLISMLNEIYSAESDYLLYNRKHIQNSNTKI